MNTSPQPILIAKSALSPEESGEVLALAAHCNQEEGLDIKFTLPVGQSETPEAFLCYVDGRLVGYCALDGGEVCGMVHRDYRRKGIGRRLLAAVLEEATRQQKLRLLLICELAAQSGQAFLAAQGATYAFGEHRMILEALPEAPWQDGRIQLQKAGMAEVEHLTQIIAESFGDPEAIARDNILQSLALPSDQFYLGWLENKPVGALKLFYEPSRVGIYAFGVLPTYQGQGIGRQMLLQACQRALAEGYPVISLEVETDNARALSVYRACGFQVTTTYGYYWVAGDSGKVV